MNADIGNARDRAFLASLREQVAWHETALKAVRSAIAIWERRIANAPETAYQRGDGAVMPKATIPVVPETKTTNRTPVQPPRSEADLLFSARRQALIAELYADATNHEIMVRLNELPGRQIIDPNRIAIQAAAQGLRKSPAYLARIGRRPPVVKPEPSRPPEPVPETPMAAAVAKALDPAPKSVVVPIVEDVPLPRQPAPAPAPLNRLAALMTVSKAIDKRANAPVDPVPVLMDFEQVRKWASERGVTFDSWDDLPRVNARAEAIGHRRIARQFPAVGRRA